MKKRRNTLLTVFGILLILIGIFLAILPSLTNNLVKNESHKVVETLEELTAEDLKENDLVEGVFDYEAINNISATKTLINRPNYNADQIIGQLVIPELDINLSLFNSLTDGNLLAGVTTMKAGQVMGEANYTIAGHYTDTKNVLLNQLVNAQKGQTIKLTNKESIYEYEIIDVIKVKSTDTFMLNDSQTQHYGHHILSIMSCYYYDTDHRWFVIGELVDTYAYSQDKMIQK